ncbi:MAG: (2Fe-2S)-binding protein [Mogibacterium sp.]|nr:(2Fe-2S)-binding protein [Mogibacterium sp.]
MKISFTINGKKMRMDVRPEKRLLDFLREDLGLTGAKEGCGIGECGACTVILNGEAVHACLMMTGQIDGAELLTVEGLEQDGRPDALQQAFLDHSAVQCGFCTPGMLMSAKALLLRNPHPTDEEIRVALAGNLCRCTGYQEIRAAVADAAGKEAAHE